MFVNRGPSIDASYQVSVHLAKRFLRRFFLNRPIRNKNFLWQPCMLMDREEMSKLYREPSIDASYQVSVHLDKGVSEEKIKMWKVNGRRTPSDGKSSLCLWQGELKMSKYPGRGICVPWTHSSFILFYFQLSETESQCQRKTFLLIYISCY